MSEVPGTLVIMADTFAAAVTTAVLIVRDAQLHVLLAPGDTSSSSALPTGYVVDDEDLARIASRCVDEAHPGAPRRYVEQLRAYGPIPQTPGVGVVTIAYLVLVDDLLDADDEEHAGTTLRPVNAVLSGKASPLVDEHRQVLVDAVQRLQTQLERTAIATDLLPREFTISELRGIYEAAWGAVGDDPNFRRKVLSSPGFLTPVERKNEETGGRPARLYRRGPAGILTPPLQRPPVNALGAVE